MSLKDTWKCGKIFDRLSASKKKGFVLAWTEGIADSGRFVRSESVRTGVTVAVLARLRHVFDV